MAEYFGKHTGCLSPQQCLTQMFITQYIGPQLNYISKKEGYIRMSEMFKNVRRFNTHALEIPQTVLVFAKCIGKML